MRLLLRRLLLTVFVLLFGFALSLVHWTGEPPRKDWATIVQIVGTVVTAYGLGHAYLRGWVEKGKDFFAFFGRIAGYIFRGITGMKGQAAHFAAERYVAEKSVLDPLASDYKQITQLNEVVNRLAQQLARIDGNLVMLAKDVERTHDKHQSELRELKNALVKDQGVDLGWAIVGLLITAVGLVMAYGT